MGAVILLLFPILKSLYSKSFSWPNRDNWTLVIVWDLLFGERVANSNLLKQISLIEAVRV